MKKIMIFVSILVTSLTLVGCTGETDTIIAPTYQGITVNESSPVNNDELVTHYQGKLGTILVEVAFTNPSNVEIKSINIDGYTYNSSRFLDGSTPQLVRLQVNVGDVLGERVYSLDEFSYLDGESVVNAKVASSNEFKVYVFKDFPEIVRESHNITKDSITVNYAIEDVDDIIILDTLRAEIYYGNDLVDTYQITSKSDVVVSFDNLDTSKQYDVKIYASFNRDDTNGLIENYLFTTDAYVTLANVSPIASIESLDFGDDFAEISVTVTDEDVVMEPGGLRVVLYDPAVYDKENPVLDQPSVYQSKPITGSVSDLVFDGLDTNKDYVIDVIADYDLDDGNGIIRDKTLDSITFKTLESAIPVPEITNLSITENVINFDFSIDNPNGIVDETTIQAIFVIDGIEYAGNVENSHVEMSVTHLLSDQDFELKIIASYNLRDGNGWITEPILEKTYSTTSNTAPTVSGADVSISQGYVTITLNVNDPDMTLVGPLAARIYVDGAPLVDGVRVPAAEVYFNSDVAEIVIPYETVKNVRYHIEIDSIYDLRDGSDEISEMLYSHDFSSANAKAPIVEVSDVEQTESTFNFDVKIIDADQTILENSAFVRIYHKDEFGNDVLVTSKAITASEMNILLDALENEDYSIYSDHEYRVDIVLKYDINNDPLNPSNPLNFTEVVLNSFTVKTTANEVPTVSLVEEELDTDFIKVDVVFTDPSSVLDMNSLKARIYHISDLEDPVEEVSLTELVTDNLTFDELYSNNDYIIVIYGEYDLRDGLGTVEVEFDSLSLKTVAKNLPLVEFFSIATTNRTLEVNFKIIDNSQVVGDNMSIVLYDSEGETTFVFTDIVTNADLTRTFTGLLSNEQYIVKVFADYNLDDDATSGELALIAESDKVFTDPLASINVEVPNIDSTLTTIDFDVNIADVDEVIVDSTKVELFELNSEGEWVTTNKEILLPDLIYSGLSFTGLTTDTSYRLIFTAQYNMNDKVEAVTGEIGRYDIDTKTKVPPTAHITNTVITESDVTFDVIFVDEYDVLTPNSLVAVLYEVGSPNVELARKNIVTFNIGFDLSGFSANQDLRIEIRGNYDLDDGENEQADQLFGAEEFTTIAFNEPTVEILGVTPTQNTIDVTIRVVDEDNVITGNLVAKLYSWDPLLEQEVFIEEIDLTVGTKTISFNQTMSAQEMYSIVVFADYNLRDDETVVTGKEMAEKLILKNANFVPEALIKDVVTTKNSITFKVDVYDYNNVILAGSTHVELLRNGEVVAVSVALSGLNNEITFIDTPLSYDVFSDAEYELVVKTNYQLEVGGDIRLNQVLYKTTVNTKEKEVPTVDIVNRNSDLNSSLDIVVNVTDVDSVVTLGSLKVKLFRENNLIDEIEVKNPGGLQLTDDFFVGLLSDTSYVIEVWVEYDLHDSNGASEYKLGTLTARTAERVMADVEVTKVEFTKTSVSMTIDVNDEDGVIDETDPTALRVVLVDSEGVSVAQALLNNEKQTISFTGLFSDEAYRIIVYADIDMKDEIRIYSDYELFRSIKYYSVAKNEMETIFSDSYVTLDEIGFDVEIIDEDVVYLSGLEARLYLATDLNSPIGLPVDLLNNSVNEVSFDGLSNNTEYIVIVYASYYLNDRVTHGEDTQIGSISLTTDRREAPSVTFSDVVITKSDVSFIASLNESYGVFKEDTLEAKLYIGETLISSKPIMVEGENTRVTFDLSGLPADQDFRIEFVGDYSLDEFVTLLEDQILGTLEDTTQANAIPSATVNSADFYQNYVTASVTVTDLDGTITNNLVAYIVDGAGLVLDTVDLVDGANDVTFNVQARVREQYTIFVRTDYDLRTSSDPEVTDYIMFEFVKYQQTELEPEAEITSVASTKTSVSVTVDVFDRFNTITGNTVVKLYLDGELKATSAPISGLATTVTFNTFSDLTPIYSGKDYVVVVETEHDGVEEFKLAEGNVSSEALTEADYDVLLDTYNSNSIVFDIVVTDIDNTTGQMFAVLSDGVNPPVQIEIFDNNNIDVTFNNLTGSTEYLLTIESLTNMNDGEGDVLVTIESLTVITEITITPTATMVVTPATNSLSVDYDLSDPDGAIITSELVLYLDDVEIDRVDAFDGENTHVFNNLEHNRNYRVELEAEYDLNDLELPYVLPLAVDDTDTDSLVSFDSISMDKDGGVVVISINDPLDLVDAPPVKPITVNLKRDGLVVATYIVTKDVPTTIDLRNLLSDYTYTMEVVADVDFGLGLQTDFVLFTEEITTEPLTMVTAEINDSENWVIGGTISFDVTASDDDDDVADNWTAHIYENGVFVESIVIANPEGTTVTVLTDGVTHVYDDSNAYTVLITADIDMNDAPATPAEVGIHITSRTYIDANES